MYNLLTMKYWFTLSPQALTPLANKMFISFIFLLLAIIIIAIIDKKKARLYKQFWEKIHNFAFTNLIIGLVFLFFNYESVPFFSARFWLGLWLIGMIIWIIFILKELKKIPQKKKELEKKDEYKKYLP